MKISRDPYGSRVFYALRDAGGSRTGCPSRLGPVSPPRTTTGGRPPGIPCGSREGWHTGPVREPSGRVGWEHTFCISHSSLTHWHRFWTTPKKRFACIIASFDVGLSWNRCLRDAWNTLWVVIGVIQCSRHSSSYTASCCSLYISVLFSRLRYWCIYPAFLSWN